MQRIQDPTAVTALPAVPALSGLAGYFTGGNPTGGIPATRVRAWWLNMIQEEILNVVQAAGLTPDATPTQLRQALRALYGGPNEWLRRILDEAGITPDINNQHLVLNALNTLFIRRHEFTNVLGNNGYMRTPGAIFQWGASISTSGTTPVVFPIAFPTAPLSVIITEQNAQGWGFPPAPTIYGVSDSTVLGFNAYAARIQTNGIPGYAAGLGFSWIAVGY